MQALKEGFVAAKAIDEEARYVWVNPLRFEYGGKEF
jgi:hypothetical protein